MRIGDIIRLGLAFLGSFALSLALNPQSKSCADLVCALVVPFTLYYLALIQVPAIKDSPFGRHTFATVLATPLTLFSFVAHGAWYALTHWRFTD